MLLDHLISYLTTTKLSTKAVYLHVLTTNQTAIRFYEHRNFRLRHFLPYYYAIEGSSRDGYCYVLYVNGGQPPWTIIYPFSRKFIYFMTALVSGRTREYIKAGVHVLAYAEVDMRCHLTSINKCSLRFLQNTEYAP